MDDATKTQRIDDALGKIGIELDRHWHGKARSAIVEFIREATDETKAKLFDIVRAS